MRNRRIIDSLGGVSVTKVIVDPFLSAELKNTENEKESGELEIDLSN